MAKDNKYLFCITQQLNDGINYYCGVSKLVMKNKFGMPIDLIGNEWSVNKEDAQTYLSRETAEKDLRDLVIAENPMAKVEPYSKKQY